MRRNTVTAAFTLMETLLVISVLAIALSMVTHMALRPRPVHAVRLVAGSVEAVRSEAISAGARARIGICVSSGAGEKYLRQVVAVVDADRDATTDDWVFTSIQKLPEGTMFWTDYSTTQRIDLDRNRKIPAIMKLTSDGSREPQEGTSGDDYVFIEFDALGQTSSSSQWVFTRAVFESDDSSEYVIPKEIDRDGFILRKTGKLAFFREPEQIVRP